LGCSSAAGDVHIKNEKEAPSLISWSHKFEMVAEEEDWSYYDDHENFIQEYFSVNYLDKRIDVTTLIEVNCIDSIIGKIDVSNDTIFLISDIFMTDDRLCSEYHKFNFSIRNPENKRYAIISTK
jgi:hypothetical protein